MANPPNYRIACRYATRPNIPGASDSTSIRDPFYALARSLETGQSFRQRHADRARLCLRFDIFDPAPATEAERAVFAVDKRLPFDRHLPITINDTHHMLRGIRPAIQHPLIKTWINRLRATNQGPVDHGFSRAVSMASATM